MTRGFGVIGLAKRRLLMEYNKAAVYEEFGGVKMIFEIVGAESLENLVRHWTNSSEFEADENKRVEMTRRKDREICVVGSSIVVDLWMESELGI